MARARTATVMSTPREPASFQTICLACSTAELGRQLLPNPWLQSRQTRVCGLMSALAYGTDGADAGGSVSVHVASGGQEHTKDRGRRRHARPHSRPELTAQHDPHCRKSKTWRTELARAAALCRSSSLKFDSALHWPCLLPTTRMKLCTYIAFMTPRGQAGDLPGLRSLGPPPFRRVLSVERLETEEE